MKTTSKTGLTASPTKQSKYTNYKKQNDIQLKAIVKQAPYILKPYSGLYNPYPRGCSLLCNHPLDQETKDLIKKAKENWCGDATQTVFLNEEIETIQANHDSRTPRRLISHIESVPEELFRRYTETDSRPLTPAPTVSSAALRASGSRRCVTPEPGSRRLKTRLVLDLRKTHSQETISYSASIHDPPLIRIQHVSRAASLEELPHPHSCPSRSTVSLQSPKKSKTASVITTSLSVFKTEKLVIPKAPDVLDNRDDGEEEYIKRRGKKKKKKPRDASNGTPAYQASMDPETQVSAIGADSINQSGRASLVPATQSQENLDSTSDHKSSSGHKSRKSLEVDSYLDTEILKQLRRELNEEEVDNELNMLRRKALQEALKAVVKDKRSCKELVDLQNELKTPSLHAELWINLPRTFTRSSARFELPMDSRTLSKLSPIDYAREHVSISSSRKLLFNCIFNKFKMEDDLENEHERKLSAHSLQEALDVLMGRKMLPEESERFRGLVGWKDDDVFDFRTFCGVAALCERLLAPSYCPRLPDRKSDPCHEIETADFDVLERKVNGQNIDERLIQILNDIKYL